MFSEAHAKYLLKKDLAKLLSADRGCSYQQAFDSIDETCLIGTDPVAIFNLIKKGLPIFNKKEAKRSKAKKP